MKYIISTTGSEIEFKLNAERLLTIERVIPMEVTDEEYIILEKRLGSQIQLVDDAATPSKVVGTPEGIDEEEEEDEDEESI